MSFLFLFSSKTSLLNFLLVVNVIIVYLDLANISGRKRPLGRGGNEINNLTCGGYPSYSQNQRDEDRHHLLVVLVISRPSGRERRDAIRQTWMRERKPGVLFKFLVGIRSLPDQVLKNLLCEDYIHSDMLLLWNVEDTLFSNTQKVLEGFIAVNMKYRFSYVMKCNDDSFVMLEKIMIELKQRDSHRSYYWGYFIKHSPVRRIGKWAEKKWFLCKTYIPYAGGVYILSQDIVRRLTMESDSLMLYKSEDVSVGVWLGPFDIERFHDERFSTLQPSSEECRKNRLVHYQNRGDMISKQRRLDESGVLCIL